MHPQAPHTCFPFPLSLQLAVQQAEDALAAKEAQLAAQLLAAEGRAQLAAEEATRAAQERHAAREGKRQAECQQEAAEMRLQRCQAEVQRLKVWVCL